MTEQLEVKSIEEATEQSVQPRAKGRTYSGFAGVLHYMAAGNYRVSPWWSPKRDRDLSSFWKSSDHLAGSLSQLITKVVTVPVRVLPRDNTLKSHRAQAEEFTIKLNEESDFGQGFMETLSKWLEDWWSADNGGFMEIIGGGKKDGPIVGPATGIAHLDSHRCTRTGDPEYPVVYQGQDGSFRKLHRARVAFASDMPSAREEMLGVGFCAASRAIHAAQNVLDIATYKEEKLGSRPLRGILVGKNISVDAILDALAISAAEMDNRNLSIFSQLALLADLPADAVLELLDIISLPDGFDEETSTRLAMFVIALAFNVPIRWLWPASAAGATKADAMFQHIAGLGGGVAKALKTLTFLLGGDPRGTHHLAGKFLPPHLKLVFDFQDDEQDRVRAEIAEKRAKARQINLETGVIDDRTAQEMALEAGDIKPSQFNRQELDNGRLPGGEPVLSLFHNSREPFLSWLDIGSDNPLSVSANDPVQMLSEINMAAINAQDVMANSPNAKKKEQAAQALAALGALKEMYAPIAQQQIQRDVMLSLGAAPGQAPPPQQPQEEGVEQGVEEEVKSILGAQFIAELVAAQAELMSGVTGQKKFDYGVSVGEIIGGQLGRGEGGRFMNAEEMMERIRAGMLERMGAGQTEGAANSAAAKRAANRAAVAEALGLDVESLALMQGGQASPEQEAAMVALGLAKQNHDGSITMTTEGRGVLRAANSGDVDKAEELRAKATAPKEEKPGKEPKKSPGDRRREQEKERQENRQEVAEGLEGRLSQEEFDALIEFSNGVDPSPETTSALAQSGLVEIDADGNARMTTAGKRVVAAANKGDLRGAKDALSEGKDRVRKQLERAQQIRDRADELNDAMPQMAEDAAQRSQDLANRADDMDSLADRYENDALAIDEEAEAFDAEGDRLDAEADAMQDMVDNAPTPEALAAAQTRQRELREQAEAKRARAKERREQARARREASASMRTQASETRGAADDLINSAQQRAQELAQSIQEMLAQAEQIESTVGGAPEEQKGLVPSIVGFFRKASEKVNPRGKALKEWPEDKPVKVTSREQKAIVRAWNNDNSLPPESKGILEARAATPEEIEKEAES